MDDLIGKPVLIRSKTAEMTNFLNSNGSNKLTIHNTNNVNLTNISNPINNLNNNGNLTNGASNTNLMHVKFHLNKFHDKLLSKRIKKLNREEMKFRLAHQRVSNDLTSFLRECKKSTGYLNFAEQQQHQQQQIMSSSSSKRKSQCGDDSRKLMLDLDLIAASSSSSSTNYVSVLKFPKTFNFDDENQIIRELKLYSNILKDYNNNNHGNDSARTCSTESLGGGEDHLVTSKLILSSSLVDKSCDPNGIESIMKINGLTPKPIEAKRSSCCKSATLVGESRRKASLNCSSYTSSPTNSNYYYYTNNTNNNYYYNNNTTNSNVLQVKMSRITIKKQIEEKAKEFRRSSSARFSSNLRQMQMNLDAKVKQF